ncbi:hypothetical protein A4A49_03571 [Nicotiana attenuata]|uniref:Uncharacterized protein n=1 Tax=Nicotiana attenuata TaxID=49451 RepID=A0A314L0R7_NICAT|nr:hypothetical protein A4A49_03571 [Nicotiana attenuata]
MKTAYVVFHKLHHFNSGMLTPNGVSSPSRKDLGRYFFYQKFFASRVILENYSTSGREICIGKIMFHRVARQYSDT